jgi:hypothetical protein
MTELEFFLVASFGPVATLVMSFVLTYLTRDKPEPPKSAESLKHFSRNARPLHGVHPAALLTCPFANPASDA